MKNKNDKYSLLKIGKSVIEDLHALARCEVTRRAAALPVVIILSGIVFPYLAPNLHKVPVFHISLAPAITAMREQHRRLEAQVNACMGEHNLPADFELIGTGSYDRFPDASRVDIGSGEIAYYALNTSTRYGWRIDPPDSPATVTEISRNDEKESKIFSALRACYTEAYENPRLG